MIGLPPHKRYIITIGYILILSGLLWPACLLAQNRKADSSLAGIYSNYQDFANGILSYTVDCSKEKQKIRLHTFLQKPFLEIFIKGEKIRLFKTDLFGYQDCKGNVFRFYSNQEYQLGEIRDLAIYFTEEDVPTGVSLIHEQVFYFSPTPDGVLLPLTVQNLKMVFSGNKKFLLLLDDRIKQESDLSHYDIERRTFMVNYLYALSLR